MWKNTVESGTPQITIWRMHIACWIPRATNTHSEYCLLLFHCNNGYKDAPQCYDIRTLQRSGDTRQQRRQKKDKILDGADLMDQPASLFLHATEKYLHKESVD